MPRVSVSPSANYLSGVCIKLSHHAACNKPTSIALDEPYPPFTLGHRIEHILLCFLHRHKVRDDFSTKCVLQYFVSFERVEALFDRRGQSAENAQL
jgi:hypothetical protein